MASNLYTIWYIFAVCILYLKSVSSAEYVPVYMWETSKNYSPLPALGRINEDFFRDILLDKLNKDIVGVAFAEECLSPEDFASYDLSESGVFAQLSNLKSDVQTNYYPFVEAPLTTLNSLPEIRVTKISSSKIPEDLDVKPGEVLIVDMNDAKENEGRREMLIRHDSIITSIFQKIASKHEKVAAILTGQHSSWVVPSEVVSKTRHSRSILEAEEVEVTNGSVFRTQNILMYSEYNSYYMTDKKKVLLSQFTENASTNDTLVLSGEGVTLQFIIEEQAGYWYIKRIEVKDENEDFNFTLRNAYAPERFSYHCNNTQLRAGTSSNTSLLLTGFQIQYLKDNYTQFSDAYDCVGFTTAPIWSGLFVTFILVSIMTFGLCMIMDIKTMDRFDDPKGKTISINVSE